MTLTNLKELTIKERLVDLDFGFFSVVFHGGKELQCCLAVNPNDFSIFKKIIVKDDCGFNEGICWDVNKWAEGEDGEIKHILDYLIEQAQIMKIEVV